MLVLVKKKLSNSFKASGSVSERGVNVFFVNLQNRSWFVYFLYGFNANKWENSSDIRAIPQFYSYFV